MHGQRLDTIKLLLNKGSIKQLRDYKNKAHLSSGFLEDRSNIDYAIVDSFSVISWELDDTHNYAPNTSMDIYTIDMITCGDAIIYSKLEDRSNVYHTDLLKEDTDKAKIILLKKDYKKTYGIDVNIHDFFPRNIVYGAGCGIAGQDPDYRKTLNIYVAATSTSMLDKWMLSPTIEIQMYALDGFNQLVQKGYKLTKEEQRLIEIILNKSGYVNTCGGCIYGNMSIYDVTTSFTLINQNRKAEKQEYGRPWYSISGMVIYKDTRLPAKGDSVKMIGSDGSIKYSVTDFNGRYSFDSTKVRSQTSYIIYGSDSRIKSEWGDSAKTYVSTVGDNPSKKFIRNLVILKK
jgi:hypothetical protein